MVAREFYVRLPAAARGASVVIHPFHQLPSLAAGKAHLNASMPLFGLAVLFGFLASYSDHPLLVIFIHDLAFPQVSNVSALLPATIFGHPIGDRHCVSHTPWYFHCPPPF